MQRISENPHLEIQTQLSTMVVSFQTNTSSNNQNEHSPSFVNMRNCEDIAKEYLFIFRIIEVMGSYSLNHGPDQLTTNYLQL